MSSQSKSWNTRSKEIRRVHARKLVEAEKTAGCYRPLRKFSNPGHLPSRPNINDEEIQDFNLNESFNLNDPYDEEVLEDNLEEVLLTDVTDDDDIDDEEDDDDDENDNCMNAVVAAITHSNIHYADIKEVMDRRLKLTTGVNSYDVIGSISDEMLQLISHKEMQDDLQLIHSNTSITKGDFARTLQSLYRAHGISNDCQLEFNLFLQNAFGNIANLPFSFSNRRKRDGSYNVVSEMEKYVRPNPIIRTFAVCQCGATVFIGSNYSAHDCSHCKSVRNEKQKVNYRLLVPTLVRLLFKDTFLDALYYLNKDKNADCYADITDGQAAVEALEEMQSIYDNAIQNIQDCSKIPINVPLLLSVAWDGGQVHKHKTSNFWPLLVSIENLPPTFRKQLGVGTFLLSLFTKELNTLVEDFIFSGCLLPELMHLNQGLTLCIEGQWYFLQARVIMFNADNPALEKMFSVKGTNSLLCPNCRSPGENLKKKHLKRTVYNCNRQLLAANNILRRKNEINSGKKFLFTKESFHHFSDLEDKAGSKLTQTLLNEMLKYFDCPTSEKNQADVIVEHTFVADHQFKSDAIEAERRRNLKSVRSQKSKYKYKEDKIAVNGVKGVSSFLSLPYFNYTRHFGFDSFHVAMNVAKHILQGVVGGRGLEQSTRNYCTLVAKVHMYLAETKRPPWAIMVVNTTTYDEAEIIDTWVNCINVPFMQKKNWQINTMYRRSGQLRGTARIDILCNIIDYIIAVSYHFASEHIPESYRWFYHLFSLDMARLHSTKISKSSYTDLRNKIIEIVSMHDAMLPPSESLYCFHQLIDVVHKIPDFGPLRSFSTLGNERAMGVITSFVGKGGTAIEETAFRKYVDYELYCMDRNYDFSLVDIFRNRSIGGRSNTINLNNFNVEANNEGELRLTYTDEPFYLYQPYCLQFSNTKSFYTHRQTTNDYEPTKFEVAEIFEAIKIDIENRIRLRNVEESEVTKLCMEESSFYRILQYYFNRPKIHELTWFREYLTIIVQKHTSNSNDACFIREIPTQSIDIVYVICNDRSIYECDINLMKILNTINCFQYTLYSRAMILGTPFITRGFENREIWNNLVPGGYGSEKMVVAYDNKRTSLPEYWKEPMHLSCWCKFKLGPNDPFEYGQINAFMQIYLPQDRTVHGTCLASVTTRKTLNFNFIDYVLGSNADSLNSTLFIPVLTIRPTPILVTGAWLIPPRTIVDAKQYENLQALNPLAKLKFMLPRSKPISVRNDLNNVTKTLNQLANCERYYDKNNSLSYLMLMEMQRSRSLITPQEKNLQEYQKIQLHTQKEIKEMFIRYDCFFDMETSNVMKQKKNNNSTIGDNDSYYWPDVEYD